MTASLFGTGALPGSGSRLSLVWRTGALALAILAISVAGQSSCTNCWPGTSGPCLGPHRVCSKAPCSSGTTRCAPATVPDMKEAVPDMKEVMDAHPEDGDEVMANEDAGSILKPVCKQCAPGTQGSCRQRKCSDCYFRTSGQCKRADNVCDKLNARGGCPPGTTPCRKCEPYSSYKTEFGVTVGVCPTGTDECEWEYDLSSFDESSPEFAAAEAEAKKFKEQEKKVKIARAKQEGEETKQKYQNMDSATLLYTTTQDAIFKQGSVGSINALQEVSAMTLGAGASAALDEALKAEESVEEEIAETIAASTTNEATQLLQTTDSESCAICGQPCRHECWTCATGKLADGSAEAELTAEENLLESALKTQAKVKHALILCRDTVGCNLVQAAYDEAGEAVRVRSYAAASQVLITALTMKVNGKCGINDAGDCKQKAIAYSCKKNPVSYQPTQPEGSDVSSRVWKDVFWKRFLDIENCAAHCEDDDDSQTDLLQTDQSDHLLGTLLLEARAKSKAKSKAKDFTCW